MIAANKAREIMEAALKENHAKELKGILGGIEHDITTSAEEGDGNVAVCADRRFHKELQMILTGEGYEVRCMLKGGSYDFDCIGISWEI